MEFDIITLNIISYMDNKLTICMLLKAVNELVHMKGGTSFVFQKMRQKTETDKDMHILKQNARVQDATTQSVEYAWLGEGSHRGPVLKVQLSERHRV